ncbi:MAG TPA: hypothetical protein VN973_04350 [Candidatus Dormibacteraeota bacterium]|nr:hypothetical protein [Candidatus Dormibacteraeota bacterium]
MALAQRRPEPRSQDLEPRPRSIRWRWPAFVITVLSLMTVPPILLNSIDYVLTTSSEFRARVSSDAPLLLVDSQGSAALFKVVR